MQRAAILAGCDFPISVRGLGESQFPGERDDATQLGVELLQTRQVEPGESFRAELSLLDPTRKLSHSCEGYVLIIFR